MKRTLRAMGLLSLLFGCTSESPFQKKDGVWRYRDQQIDVDVGSFQPLGKHYAKDARRVYYCDTYRDGGEYWLVRHVRTVVLDSADVATFQTLDDDHARDRRRVYYEGIQFPVRDVASFEVLDYGFARDTVTGYYMRQPVPGSDGPTFTVVDPRWAKDSATVFHAHVEPRQDGKPPDVITKRIAGALAPSFAAFEFGYARDAARVYYDDHAITTDVATFEMLDLGYARTGSVVFYNGDVVEGADAATFSMLQQVTDSADAQDAKSMFRSGQRTKAR